MPSPPVPPKAPTPSGPETPEALGALPESPVKMLRRQISEGLDLNFHEEQKQGLVVSGIAVGLVALWLLR